MFKSIKKFSASILDFILPPRTDFVIVKELNEEKINNLPEAEGVTEMDWIHPLFHYKDNRVRAIIWELKYRENVFPLEYIGKLIYEEIIALISDIVLFDNDAQFLSFFLIISILEPSTAALSIPALINSLLIFKYKHIAAAQQALYIL